jgi:hypothetical protein
MAAAVYAGAAKEEKGEYTMNANTICLLVAAACFFIGAIGFDARINWTNAGLCFVTLSLLV